MTINYEEKLQASINGEKEYSIKISPTSLEINLKLFYWKFVESISTMYPHVYFALARDKNHAIDLIRLQLDFSDRQKEKESSFILKSIALNEPEIIETEKGILILSKC